MSTYSLPSPGGRRHPCGPHRIALGAVLALALAVPASASAQASDADKATARALAQQGQDALEKRDFATAADRFGRAVELVHVPTLGLGLARAQLGLGKWVAAAETYNRVVREGVPAGAPPVFVKALADARKELAELEPRVPSVTLAVRGAPSARVTIDGAAVPNAALGVLRPVDPGKHVVRAEADGFVPAQASFTAVERKGESVTLTLEPDRTAPATPPPSPPMATPPPGPQVGAGPQAGVTPGPSPRPIEPPRPSSSASVRKTLGIVGLGVGGAGLVLGAVTGGLAIGKHGTLAKACSDGVCPLDQKSALGGYHALTSASTAGFVAGGVLAATGLVLVVTAPRASAPAGAGVSPVVGAGFVGAEGWF